MYREYTKLVNRVLHHAVKSIAFTQQTRTAI